MRLSRQLHPQIRPETIEARKHRVPLTNITAKLGLDYDTVRYKWE